MDAITSYTSGRKKIKDRIYIGYESANLRNTYQDCNCLDMYGPSLV